MRRRHFEFAAQGDGIQNMTVSESAEKKRSTTVALRGFIPRYQQQSPKKIETIATHLIEHCLERPDQSWSLTDCASCLIMREQGIQEALAHDKHFEQMGFKALLRDDRDD